MFDVAKAREFYLDDLGFALGFEHRFAPDLPLDMEVRRDGCVLHLSEHRGDATPASAVRIEVGDIDAFHAELRAKPYRFARPGIGTMPWGMREVTVGDPFGNRLVFHARVQ
jgi:catechol 2,3-dioxygenase-like lactoylglutathione lyase family enzyme